jgi:hypothetical protein
MRDSLDIIKNIQTISSTNSSLAILKDFERVIDELDLYVYKNWIDGELVEGPITERHWVSASFMWPKQNMPDPMGGKRLLDYGCKVEYIRSHLVEPRPVEDPDDFRPGTKKGKLDRTPVWEVKITMPKKLLTDIYNGYMNRMKEDMGITQRGERITGSDAQPADQTAVATGMDQASMMPQGMPQGMPQ